MTEYQIYTLKNLEEKKQFYQPQQSETSQLAYEVGLPVPRGFCYISKPISAAAVLPLLSR